MKKSDFAADISRVVNRTATAEYQDAESFFARTYVTEGMKQLLIAVACRLNGLGDELVSHSVFIDAVRGGVKGGLFGYAVGRAEDGAYVNFKFAEEPGMIGISDVEILIKEDLAEVYRAKEAKVTDEEPSTPKTPTGKTNPVPTTSTSVSVIPTPSKRKFVGYVRVDVTNGTAALQQIVDEVIANLAAKGFNAAVSLEITA